MLHTEPVARAQALLDSLKEGDISQSCYDMAWVLRSEVLDEEEQSNLLTAIISARHPDGSWGAELSYIHDRVINTLAVVVALKEQGGFDGLVDQGIQYLSKSIPLLLTESVETIGFELTFLALLKEAQQFKMNLPFDSEAVLYYSRLAEEKKKLLNTIPLSSPTTVAHSLESFYDSSLSFDKVAIFTNGSLGNSPAATAFYIKRQGKDRTSRSIEYIKNFKKTNWRIPSIYPFEVFEKAWILYHFLHAGILHQLDFRKHTDYLWEHWQRFKGASISNTFPIIDSDDTAIVYIVLRETQYPVKADAFKPFELQHWFRCFDLERNPSISANIHVLEALLLCDDYTAREQSITKILIFLEGVFDKTWVDKWNISPFYCASHLVLALKHHKHPLRDKAVQYLLSTQNFDGGWGRNGSSIEETKYVLLAFNVLSDKGDEVRTAVKKAKRFLTNYSQKNTVELWVDKGLYAPLAVIESLNLIDV